MARLTRTRRLWFSLLLTLVLVAVEPGAASAVTLNVANNGEDSDGCGAEGSPCRSISRAIANAAHGDTIIVGPGRYGDLDGDGAFGGTGEETAPAECGCMIDVNKQVTLQSRDGAGVTVLDAGGANVDVVRITVAAVFGGREKGFSLTRGDSGLVFSTPHFAPLTVQGNLAIRNARSGFDVHGYTIGVQLMNNFAVANGSYGFSLRVAQCELTGNLAAANGINGFQIENNRDRRVLASELKNNVAVANQGYGFAIVGGPSAPTTLRRNAALGNRRFGIGLAAEPVRITENNVYGNNSQEFAGHTNCGLHISDNVGGPVDATNNFWGSADGPGLDPADAICNDGEAGIDSAPFAVREFRIDLRPLMVRPLLPLPPVDVLPHD